MPNADRQECNCQSYNADCACQEIRVSCDISGEFAGSYPTQFWMKINQNGRFESKSAETACHSGGGSLKWVKLLSAFWQNDARSTVDGWKILDSELH